MRRKICYTYKVHIVSGEVKNSIFSKPFFLSLLVGIEEKMNFFEKIEEKNSKNFNTIICRYAKVSKSSNSGKKEFWSELFCLN